MDAYRDGMRRHPESRVVRESARFGRRYPVPAVCRGRAMLRIRIAPVAGSSLVEAGPAPLLGTEQSSGDGSSSCERKTERFR